MKLQQMRIGYQLERFRAWNRCRRKKRKVARAMRQMNPDQLKAFNKVKELAINYRSAIRFDPKTGKIMIDLPKILVTLKRNTIYVDNSSGFGYQIMTDDSYELLKEVIEMEAHKDRRKSEFEAKIRVRNFWTNINHTSDTEKISESGKRGEDTEGK
jgi:hypothetical protein